MKRWEQEQERRDYRAGMIASTIANGYRDTKKKREPFTPQDFMPERVARKPREMTGDESFNFVRLLNASLGGIDRVGAH